MISTLAVTHPYTGISLPAVTASWISPDRDKATTNSYFSHQLTSMAGDYNYVNVYQQSDIYVDPVSPTIKHREGDPMQNVHWYSGFNASLAKDHNTNLGVRNASASGKYDLR